MSYSRDDLSRLVDVCFTREFKKRITLLENEVKEKQISDEDAVVMFDNCVKDILSGLSFENSIKIDFKKENEEWIGIPIALDSLGCQVVSVIKM